MVKLNSDPSLSEDEDFESFLCSLQRLVEDGPFSMLPVLTTLIDTFPPALATGMENNDAVPLENFLAALFTLVAGSCVEHQITDAPEKSHIQHLFLSFLINEKYVRYDATTNKVVLLEKELFALRSDLPNQAKEAAKRACDPSTFFPPGSEKRFAKAVEATKRFFLSYQPV